MNFTVYNEFDTAFEHGIILSCSSDLSETGCEPISVELKKEISAWVIETGNEWLRECAKEEGVEIDLCVNCEINKILTVKNKDGKFICSIH